MSAEEILEQFRLLSVDEQCDVARRIADEFEQELTPEQVAKLEERADRLRRHPENGIPWEQVRAELKDRLEKRRACRGE